MRSREQILAWIAEIEEHKEDDCCMCGMSMDHSCWEGHTPVSQYQYYLDAALKELAENTNEA